MDMEATVMELIINAGESRSLAMQALQAARKGVWQDVDRLMQDAADAAKLLVNRHFRVALAAGVPELRAAVAAESPC